MSKSGDSHVLLWDPATDVALGELGRWKGVMAIDASRDGATLAAASLEDVSTIFDVATRRRLRTLKSDPVYQIAMSPRGNRLIAVLKTRLVAWDCATGDRLLDVKIDDENADRCAFCGGDRLVVAAGYTSGVYLWNLDEGKRSFKFEPPGANVLWLTATDDGRYVAAGCGDDNVRIWDALTGRLLAALKGHRGPVHAVTFFPGDHRLASGSDDCTILVWDVDGCVKQTEAQRQSRWMP